MPIVQYEISDYTATINQEIKDKGLTSKDKEYFRLKNREMYHRRLILKKDCPVCGKSLAVRTLDRGKHKCKGPKPADFVLNV